MMGNQTPGEGSLIRTARKARGLSAKEAAGRTPIRLGESRWYHIEAGKEGTGNPVVAPPDTLAHMARVVGVTPEQLVDVGRDDAASVLREIIRQEQSGADSHPPEPPQYAEVWKQKIWEIDELSPGERRLAIGTIEALRRERDADTESRRRGSA